MSADKYPSIFSRQMKAIVYLLIIFHVKTVTRIARTLARMNCMARSVTWLAY